ncbi:hypothetical protein Pmani_020894 [Petrolisthes manimaculis]|uniref:Uncharacterized protein n=1 Tax=Petrolisthes manimaculis TaxID=1843537 RepID=A0AAE1PHJ0_9EUCA|nr:hypothetical protein Pmani_020894 [Petrolisthes manimaculis]
MFHHSTSRFRSQARNIIWNVYRYFSAQWGGDSSAEVLEKTAKATHVSVKTVRRVQRQASECDPNPITSPVYHPKKLRVRIKLDDFDKECIRKEVLSFYERGEIPTVDALLERVREEPVKFEGGKTTLWKVIREIGFKYAKLRSGRAILMEREDIVVKRNQYLRAMEKNRKCSPLKRRPEVYVDETWVNQNECVEQCWTISDGSVGPKIKTVSLSMLA